MGIPIEADVYSRRSAVYARKYFLLRYFLARLVPAELVVQRNHFTDQDERRRAHVVVGDDSPQAVEIADEYPDLK